MAELSPPGFEFMVRAVRRLAIIHALADVAVGGRVVECSSLACLELQIARRRLSDRT